MEWVIISFSIAGLLFCMTQFVDLMRRSDDEFPGRFDKPIWAATILLTNVLGAFLFLVYKPKEAPESSPSLRAELTKARPADSPANAG